MRDRFLLCLIAPLAACTVGEDSPVYDRVGDLVVLTSGMRIVSVDRDAPGTLVHEIEITGLGSESLVGIDRRPADAMLWGLSSAGRLYTIDAATGVATPKSMLAADPTDTTAPFAGLSGSNFGVDFNPVPDRLRITTDTGLNLRINVNTGATTTDGAINGAATGYGSVAYTTSFAAACRTTLFAIDVATDSLMLQNPPNTGAAVVVGSLGIDAEAIADFDIETTASSTLALAALTASGETALYSIDTSSGAATKLGKLPLTGETAISIVAKVPSPDDIIPQAAGELFGATESNRLVSFNRASPGKACTNAPITGLSTGDTIIGIDYRPSTGVLHALTNNAGTGKLYTVNPMTGEATAPVTLALKLTGTSFGMDFNPTGPVALRIISDTGQNLRVTDIATGATTADTTLNGAVMKATEAAYTNSVAGATSTTLHILDVGADRLRIQNPPNAGTVIDVGALGVDVDTIAGFDIDGRDNVAFVAANLTGSTATTLHNLDLTTGALSASLGSFSGERIRGITRTSP